MDEKDIRICQLLFVNSRMPIRDLADALDISVQAAHRRLQILIDEKVIRKFTANISYTHLNVVQVNISGKSDLEGIEDVIEALSSSDKTHLALFASGGYVFFQAILKEISELEDYMELVKNRVKISDPVVKFQSRIQVGEGDLRPKSEGELSKTDYKIIRSLHLDSRKNIADISNEIGMSPKTVKKRLDHMMENKLVEFSIDWDPTASPGAPSMIFIKVRSGTDKNALKRWVRENFGARVHMIGNYLDLPDEMLFMTWSPTVLLHNEIVEALDSHEDIEKVNSNLAVGGHFFESWRDRILEERAR